MLGDVFMCSEKVGRFRFILLTLDDAFFVNRMHTQQWEEVGNDFVLSLHCQSTQKRPKDTTVRWRSSKSNCCNKPQNGPDFFIKQFVLFTI